MSKSLKSIEEQKQDIVKYTSYFIGTKVYDQVDTSMVRVCCPNPVVLEVLLDYFQTNGYVVHSVVNDQVKRDFSSMIKLLPPAIDSAALVAMMRKYLATLDDSTKTEVYDTYRQIAGNELADFCQYFGCRLE